MVVVVVVVVVLVGVLVVVLVMVLVAVLAMVLVVALVTENGSSKDRDTEIERGGRGRTCGYVSKVVFKAEVDLGPHMQGYLLCHGVHAHAFAGCTKTHPAAHDITFCAYWYNLASSLLDS